MKLAKYKELHEKNYGPEYGGHVQYFVATKKMVPLLIKVAESAERLLGEGQCLHRDSTAYQNLLGDLHRTLRDVESVR